MVSLPVFYVVYLTCYLRRDSSNLITICYRYVRRRRKMSSSFFNLKCLWFLLRVVSLVSNRNKIIHKRCTENDKQGLCCLNCKGSGEKLSGEINHWTWYFNSFAAIKTPKPCEPHRGVQEKKENAFSFWILWSHTFKRAGKKPQRVSNLETEALYGHLVSLYVGLTVANFRSETHPSLYQDASAGYPSPILVRMCSEGNKY